MKKPTFGQINPVVRKSDSMLRRVFLALGVCSILTLAGMVTYLGPKSFLNTVALTSTKQERPEVDSPKFKDSIHRLRANLNGTTSNLISSIEL